MFFSFFFFGRLKLIRQNTPGDLQFQVLILLCRENLKKIKPLIHKVHKEVLHKVVVTCTLCFNAVGHNIQNIGATMSWIWQVLRPTMAETKKMIHSKSTSHTSHTVHCYSVKSGLLRSGCLFERSANDRGEEITAELQGKYVFAIFSLESTFLPRPSFFFFHAVGLSRGLPEHCRWNDDPWTHTGTDQFATGGGMCPLRCFPTIGFETFVFQSSSGERQETAQSHCIHGTTINKPICPTSILTVSSRRLLLSLCSLNQISTSSKCCLSPPWLSRHSTWCQF